MHHFAHTLKLQRLWLMRMCPVWLPCIPQWANIFCVPPVTADLSGLLAPRHLRVLGGGVLCLLQPYMCQIICCLEHLYGCTMVWHGCLSVLWYGEGQREWHSENSRLYTVWVNRDIMCCMIWIFEFKCMVRYSIGIGGN